MTGCMINNSLMRVTGRDGRSTLPTDGWSRPNLFTLHLFIKLQAMFINHMIVYKQANLRNTIVELHDRNINDKYQIVVKTVLSIKMFHWEFIDFICLNNCFNILSCVFTLLYSFYFSSETYVLSLVLYFDNILLT